MGQPNELAQLGWAACIATILVTALAGYGLFHDDHGRNPACVRWPSQARLLLVGDTMRLSAGTLYFGSDCDPPAPQRVWWNSAHPAVAPVDSEGLVRGLTPGRFTAIGFSGPDTLHAEGFVLPPRWTARIIPESVTVSVGDSVSFVVIALDSMGHQLPAVPYSLVTPAWHLVGSSDTVGRKSPPQLTTEQAFLDVTTPSVFHMVKAGTTILLGRLGEMHLTAAIVVLRQADVRGEDSHRRKAP